MNESESALATAQQQKRAKLVDQLNEADFICCGLCGVLVKMKLKDRHQQQYHDNQAFVIDDDVVNNAPADPVQVPDEPLMAEEMIEDPPQVAAPTENSTITTNASAADESASQVDVVNSQVREVEIRRSKRAKKSTAVDTQKRQMTTGHSSASRNKSAVRNGSATQKKSAHAGELLFY